MFAMLIAMAMTSVAMYLFDQTQRGTRISLAKAQLMLTANTVDSRLRMDAATMRGPDRSWSGSVPAAANPSAGGCLLVIPSLRQGYIPLANGQMSKHKVRLRSDQLVFLSKRDPSQPHPWVSMLPLPGNAAPVATSISPSSSWEARIWYGAVRDGNYAGGDGSASDPGAQAQLWQVGRQAKLLVQGQKAGPMDCTVTADNDTTAGGLVKPSVGTTWPGLKDTALSGSWTDDAYVANLVGKTSSGTTLMTAAEQLDHANAPVTTPTIDLKQLQHGDAASGLQLGDISNSHLRLFENCSEMVVQWAGDLDKDGQIDTYPAGHPLGGAIIWYPEELHTNAQKNATTKTRLTGSLLTKYNAIEANPWHTKSFSAGFTPYLAAWPRGRFGGGTWPDRFQFDYGETDNPSGQATATAVSVPKPYVFRFDDDQYRLVRYGYRQDGSCYKNKWDGKPLPAGSKHWFPYPPAVGDSMSLSFAAYYDNKVAPAGPYPVAAAVAASTAPGMNNFGDLMGGSCLPADCGARTYRTAGTGQAFLADGVTPDPERFGYLITVTNAAIPSAPGTSNIWSLPSAAMTLAQGAASAAGAEPLWPYYSGGRLVALYQAGGIAASMPRPACDATPDTPLPSVANPIGPMVRQFGPGNNFTVTYTDIWSEYLKTINSPTQAADANPTSREDWRMPQSDWPRLIRMRVRLHDPQALVASYSDEFLINGRDNDGDGVVNNPEEGRMSGMWFEYVFAVPYPTDPTPRQH